MAELGTSPPPTARRFAPTPVETTVKKVRRFAVEPVETTSRSNRREEAQKLEDITTTTNITTDEKKQKVDVPTKRRFAPEPLETTVRSSKQAANTIPTPEPTPTDIPEQAVKEEVPRPRRKFVPELIETLKRSKRAGDVRPATLPTDKTDLTPGVPNIYTRSTSRPPAAPTPPYNTPVNSNHNIHQHHFHPPLPRRQGSMKPHCNTRRSTRQNSFQPELDVILSDPNSEEEERDSSIGHTTPSLSRSFGSSDDSDIRLQMARTRESCDDRFSGYLLELAAKAAEKQLREQALAAFPNENFHETVEHFYDREIEGHSDAGSVEGVGLLIDDEDESTLPLEIRRKSTIEPGWEAREMQEHQETLQRMREDETNVKIAEEASRPSFHDPFWTNGMTTKFAQATEVPERRDPIKEKEMAKMRSAASPPMLGGDLKFRMCPSPKATKFESDQKPDIQLKKSETGGGLWGGYCVTDEADQYLSPATDRGPMLLQTPQVEREDPFAAAFTSSSKLPSGARSPRSSGIGMLSGLDERLQKEVQRSKAEELILAEFDDAFVTQVYNYLSLGYPSLAYQFDEELAKIAHVPESELSADDSKKQAKGYLGIKQASGEVTQQVKDKRWAALKVYILEWAKQHPSLNEEGRDLNAWGVRARRGSWAI